MPEPGGMRASNQDRERVAQVLHTAMAEGRLTVAELQERLDSVYASKTLAELEPITRDLPGHQAVVPRPAAPPVPAPPVPAPMARQVARVGGEPTSTAAIAIMSGSERKGAWVVPRQFKAVALMGGIELDLTRASFVDRETTITAIAIMGGVEITVSEDLTVVLSGIGVMGAFEDNAKYPGTPGGPIVRVNGVALMGAVEVRRPKVKDRRELES